MKAIKIFFLFLFLIAAQAQAQAYKGLYVDGFDKILGNRPLEDQLLNYCRQNSFNAICTYKTKDIEKKLAITNPKTGGKVLASFIKRAKQSYGIVSFAMSSEQFDTFNRIVATYNRYRADTLERVNVFNFEFEFWNRNSTAPDGYYCKKYLQKSGCTCDTSGAFRYYRKELKRIDSLANAVGVKTEVYVGKPNAGQALVIAGLVDRVLVDVYLKKPEKAFERAEERLLAFDRFPHRLNVIPIWGSTDEFLGEWQQQHKHSEADALFLQDFSAQKTRFKHIQIIGFQWYKYSTMKQ